MKIPSILLSLVLGVGCANAATVTEKSPVTQDLGAFHTATVAVTVAPGIENPDVFKSQLTTFVESRLKEKKLFTEVVAEGGDLTLKITINKLDKPMSIAGVPGGESDTTASVELFDAKASKSVGAFDISATSKRNTSTSVGGVNTKTGDDPRKRALEAAADQVASYIEKHRAGGAK